jgi:hypothetical protein
MKTNMALIDRTVRVGVGMSLLATPLLEFSTFPYNLLGLIPLVTGFVGFCPLYSVFGSGEARRAAIPAHGVARAR